MLCMQKPEFPAQQKIGVTDIQTQNEMQIPIVVHAQKIVDSYMQMTRNVVAGIPRGVRMHAPLHPPQMKPCISKYYIWPVLLCT